MCLLVHGRGPMAIQSRLVMPAPGGCAKEPVRDAQTGLVA
jgi:hypothetical protein